MIGEPQIEAVAGRVHDQHVFFAIHQLGNARQADHQRVDRAMRQIIARPVRSSQNKRAPLRIVSSFKNPPGLARFAGKNGIAIKRDGNHVGVHCAAPLRL